ncbi:MAG TPA: tetratricopeptide repeat protein [Thermoanaerobaculia bacterium]|nr:tetratricopeptide repeat protein [Thermoanaerobaculia bacterium]
MPSPSLAPRGAARRRAEAGYATAEVARMLGLAPRQVRELVAAGLLAPRGGGGSAYRFSFQDLVVLRAAQGLLAAGIPMARVKTALARLAAELPGGRGLTAVRIVAEGGQVVARDGEGAWEPESGQRQLPFPDLADFEPFAVADLAARAAPFGRRLLADAERRGDLAADDWFELAFELEATAPEEARTAYERALDRDPGHPDARLNLGRLLHAAGDPAAALPHYRRAAASRPNDPTAHYNVGVALQDTGDAEGACAAYARALALDPAFADAHFNLAGLYAQLGDRRRALAALLAYRSLTRR